MKATLFKEVGYSLAKLVEDIDMGEIGLPDYLGEIDNQLKSGVPVNMPGFKAQLRKHMAIKAPKPIAWNRVLRRYYTLARRLESDVLLKYSFQHIAEAPDSARHIFEYLSTFPVTAKRFDALTEALAQLGGVYEDVELLAHEYLCSAPNRLTIVMRKKLGDWALSQWSDKCIVWPRLAAAACLTLGKFGDDDHIATLQKEFQTVLKSDTVARQQALVVLAGAAHLSREEIAATTPVTDPMSAQHVRFLMEVMVGEYEATARAIYLIEPLRRTSPDRSVIRTRALFLAPLVARHGSSQWKSLSAKWLLKLQANALRYRDREAERWLSMQ